MPKSSNGEPSQENKSEGLGASLQVLPVPPGLYLFSVPNGVVTPVSEGGLTVPALHVGIGPGAAPDQVEFLNGHTTKGTWMFNAGDMLIAKVSGDGASLVLTSVKSPSGGALSVNIERLDSRLENGNQPAVRSEQKVETPDANVVGLEIIAHMRTRGDLTFTKSTWAGRIAPGLWMEAFSVRPLSGLQASEIECKGLTGSGFETPWISDGNSCGTKGMATPLVGFAIRLKPAAAARGLDCEYSGYFQSGITVGPLRNGAPCRSNVANDSLEGIQLRVFKLADSAIVETAPPASRPSVTDKEARATRRKS